MRLDLLLVALPFATAISQGLPRESAQTPDRNRGGTLHNLRGDGPRNKATNTTRGAGNKRPSAKKGQAAGTSPSTGSGLKVVILADSNRDGKVDMTGNSDLKGKEKWTPTFGALFLANIVDTDRRCSSQIKGSCADEISDSYTNRDKWPKEPVLNPKFEVKGPFDSAKEQKLLKSLSTSDRAEYEEYKKKKKEYPLVYDEMKKTEISLCHDSFDNVLRNATYLAPLRTKPIRSLGNSATGSINVTDKTAASKVRIFHKTGGKWVFAPSNYTFKASQLKAGLELGIDARDVRRPGGWDGRAIVEFKVKDGKNAAKDTVALRVAPVLTQHHGQSAKQVLSASGSLDEAQKRFLKDLGEASSKAGIKTPLHVFDTSECKFRRFPGDPWAQDIVEPGYMSIPGPKGPVSIHIMIRSSVDHREAGRKVFQDLRSNTVGAVQNLSIGDTLDSLGNLETVPPHSYKGKSYAAGRAVMGSADGKKPEMMAFLEAQETQAPISLDTSWLAVKHVDEFMQFLPVKSKRGWVMMVGDARAGLKILQKAQKDGHGDETAGSRQKRPGDPEKWRSTNTIDDLLNVSNFAGFQEACARNTDKNIDIMKQETGITDSEIIRVPALYQAYEENLWKYSEMSNAPVDQALIDDIFESAPTGNNRRRRAPSQIIGHKAHKDAHKQIGKAVNGTRKGSRPKVLDALQAGTPPQGWKNHTANAMTNSLEGRQAESMNGSAIALYPAAINSVVLNNKQIVAPNPWGPVIQEKDVLAEAVSAAYKSVNYTVVYIDDWFTHHDNVGDVHCGSSVIRELEAVKWW